MKRFYIILLSFFYPTVVLFSQTGPKLEINSNINAGKFLQGKEVVYNIPFKNSGDAELKIFGLGTACGCSTALLSGDTFKPGDSGSIQFKFNGQSVGSVTKTLSFSTNEPENSTHIIQINMVMVNPINFTPQSIITEGKVGDEIKQTGSVQNTLDKTIEILEVSSNTPVIKISSDKKILSAGETSNLEISIKLFEETTINATIFIKTSEGDFQIPVLVDVKPN